MIARKGGYLYAYNSIILLAVCQGIKKCPISEEIRHLKTFYALPNPAAKNADDTVTATAIVAVITATVVITVVITSVVGIIAQNVVTIGAISFRLSVDIA